MTMAYVIVTNLINPVESKRFTVMHYIMQRPVYPLFSNKWVVSKPLSSVWELDHLVNEYHVLCPNWALRDGL